MPGDTCLIGVPFLPGNASVLVLHYRGFISTHPATKLIGLGAKPQVVQQALTGEGKQELAGVVRVLMNARWDTSALQCVTGAGKETRTKKKKTCLFMTARKATDKL